MDTTKTDLLKDVLESHKDCYYELSENWRHLDGKAQSFVTIAGIFLAGLLVFVDSSNPKLCLDRFFVVGSILLIVVSVGCCLKALWLRVVDAPPLGEDLEKMINDLSASGNSLDITSIDNLYQDHTRLWKDANTQINDVNQDKANYIYFAQIALSLAMFMAVIFILTNVW